MEKIIKKITIVSSKKTPKYEVRSEHVLFSDGSTEDRIRCYTFDGHMLGGIREAEHYLKALEEVLPSFKLPQAKSTRKGNK